MEDYFPFLADRDVLIGIFVRVGGLSHASMAGYRHKSLPVDGLFVDLQAARHQRGGSAIIDDSATATIDAHYSRPGRVSFDEGNFKLTALALERFVRFGESGNE